MARSKSRWICQQCGYQTSGFLGRCTDCGGWNTLVEERLPEETAERKAVASARGRAVDKDLNRPVALCSIAIEDEPSMARLSTGLHDVDEVLGGGLVPGSVVLITGDPGIGKSTLLLQIAHHIAKEEKVLYISGEESASQVRLRATRLKTVRENVLLCAEQNILEIQDSMLNSGCALAIVDSIQAVYHPDISSAAGSVSQVRESANTLVTAAKTQGIATIIVGHVTKDGSIAGPRVLEHMVDVVLQFEGDRARQLRLLRSPKNRFGSTLEIAVLKMTELGLVSVDNPSALFLGDRLSKLGRRQAPPGTAVITGGDGNRSILLEVQALVGTSSYSTPRRVVNGWDHNRLLQVLAVLEKKVGLHLSRSDVYVNIAGGMEFNDPSGDLGIAFAVATSFLDRSVDPGLVLMGELGLTGEIRPVTSLARRLKEAAKMGFRRAIVPKGNLPLSIGGELNVVGVEQLSEALALALPGSSFPLSRSRTKADIPGDSLPDSDSDPEIETMPQPGRSFSVHPVHE